MSIRYYDEAIYNKIQKWITDDRMMILKPDETSRLFRNIADKTNDKPIRLPLIALSRDRSLHIDVETKRNLSYDGRKLEGNSKNTAQLNAIPFTVNYQLDIYCVELEEAYAYAEEFIFQIINHPKLQIETNYNGVKVNHIANIRLYPDISDNSDIPERLYDGEFSRLTLQFELQDAYIFNTPVNKNYKIGEVELHLKENDLDSTISSVEPIED